MNDNKAQNEPNEQEELRDLDVPELDAEDVKGGYAFITPDNVPDVFKAKPKDPASGGSR